MTSAAYDLAVLSVGADGHGGYGAARCIRCAEIAALLPEQRP